MEMTSTYVSEYDPLNTNSYDPQYTAIISNRMQVPESIHFGEPRPSALRFVEESPRAKMKVPERILLAGDNHHVGLREEFHNLDFDYAKSKVQRVDLSSPPRILKIEDSLPTDENGEYDNGGNSEGRGAAGHRQDRSFLNGLVSMDTSYRSVSPLPLSAELLADESLVANGQEDDVVNMRHQVARLQRHVIHLEEENELRSRREMILYPTLLIYFLFQMGKWFFSRN